MPSSLLMPQWRRDIIAEVITTIDCSRHCGLTLSPPIIVILRRAMNASAYTSSPMPMLPPPATPYLLAAFLAFDAPFILAGRRPSVDADSPMRRFARRECSPRGAWRAR